MRRRIAAALLAAAALPLAAQPGLAQDAAAPALDVPVPKGAHDYGFAGMMAKDNRADLPPLTLAAGKPVAAGTYHLKSGTYYRIEIEADGSQELALSGGDFFRAVWINEIVVNDIEIRPMGVHSIEFDSAGTALISFVPIVPGTYKLSIPGSHSESQSATFVVQ